MTARVRARSLTAHLITWALAALGLVWGSIAVVGYLTGEHEADELTDGHLASVAALLLAVDGSALVATPAPTPASPVGALRAHDYQQSLSVVVWDGAGRVLARRGGAPLPAFDAPEGFATLALGVPPQGWRAFSAWDPGRERRVMVLLSARERDELADDIATQVTQPVLWVLPGVALLLGLAIRRGLRPLYQLTQEIAALDVRQPGGLPARPRETELQAVAQAIELLLARARSALARERGLADAFAHELRTPLTALSLQVAAVRAAADAPARDHAVAQIEQEAVRCARVLAQLLALARAGRAELEGAATLLDVAAVAQAVVAEAAPAADAQGRALGLEVESSFSLRGHPVLLALALRNLVENALAHTPAGTEVVVQVDGAARTLQVVDDGPARLQEAAPALQAAAGGPAREDAMAAPLGLGLGMEVVRRVAALHGAVHESARLADGSRRCERLRFPVPPADPQA